MKTQAIPQLNSITEEYLRFPGCYSWQKFKIIEIAIENSPGIRIFFILIGVLK